MRSRCDLSETILSKQQTAALMVVNPMKNTPVNVAKEQPKTPDKMPKKDEKKPKQNQK